MNFIDFMDESFHENCPWKSHTAWKIRVKCLLFYRINHWFMKTEIYIRWNLWLYGSSWKFFNGTSNIKLRPSSLQHSWSTKFEQSFHYFGIAPHRRLFNNIRRHTKFNVLIKLTSKKCLCLYQQIWGHLLYSMSHHKSMNFIDFMDES